jgi:hypothetical protein
MVAASHYFYPIMFTCYELNKVPGLCVNMHQLDAYFEKIKTDLFMITTKKKEGKDKGALVPELQRQLNY